MTQDIVIRGFGIFISISIAIVFLTDLLTNELMTLHRRTFVERRRELGLRVRLRRLSCVERGGHLTVRVRSSLAGGLSSVSLVTQIRVSRGVPSDSS